MYICTIYTNSGMINANICTNQCNIGIINADIAANYINKVVLHQYWYHLHQ